MCSCKEKKISDAKFSPFSILQCYSRGSFLQCYSRGTPFSILCHRRVGPEVREERPWRSDGCCARRSDEHRTSRSFSNLRLASAPVPALLLFSFFPLLQASPPLSTRPFPIHHLRRPPPQITERTTTRRHHLASPVPAAAAKR